MKPRPWKHIRDLAHELDCSPAEAMDKIENLRAAVRPHGLTVAYVTRYRQWWISGFVGTETLFGMMKCDGIGAFIDYLLNPQSIIDWFAARTVEEEKRIAIKSPGSALEAFAA